MLFCGIALDYEDKSAPINRWRLPPARREDFACFRGFPP
jgi:hypothetical protein